MRIAVSTKDNGQFCQNLKAKGELQGAVQDFCSPHPADAYLRVYAMVISDFDVNDYKDTLGMTILFVIVTLLGVIIMLNVLIAVISDSYEKAKIESAVLFGGARITFVAQNQALESFLRPGTNPINELKVIKSPGTALMVFGRILRWFVLISLLVTAMYAEVYLVSRAVTGFRTRQLPLLTMVIVVILVLILTAALWVLFFFTLSGLVQSVLPKKMNDSVSALDRCTDKFVKSVASRLFGLVEVTRSKATFDEETGEAGEEWTGRLTYMEKSFERAVSKATDDLKTEMFSLERRIYAHDDILFNERMNLTMNHDPYLDEQPLHHPPEAYRPPHTQGSQGRFHPASDNVGNHTNQEHEAPHPESYRSSI